MSSPAHKIRIKDPRTGIVVLLVLLGVRPI